MKVDIEVLTPSYGYQRFMGDAARSVSQQIGSPARHLVQDAESSDGTGEMLRAEFPAVDLVSEPDGGQSDGLNRALARASADVVGWLNADEFYLAGALEKVRAAFAAHPDTDVLYGNAVFVDEQGRGIRALPAHAWSRLVLQDYGCFIPSCATFVRTDALRGLGWDPTFRRAMDWDLWLGLAGRGARFRHLPDELAAFRVHGAQVTAVPESADREEFDRLRAKHGLRRRSWPRAARARGLHVGLKLVSGGYLRQLAFRFRQRGTDLSWWRP